MSFKCDFCGKGAPVGSKPVMIVEKVDGFVHPQRSYANRVKIEGERQFSPDNGGKGPQIKKERKACPKCAEVYKSSAHLDTK